VFFRHTASDYTFGKLFRPFGFISLKHFKLIWLSNLWILSVLDEVYSRNMSHALILIFTFLLLVLTTFVQSVNISHYKGQTLPENSMLAGGV